MILKTGFPLINGFQLIAILLITTSYQQAKKANSNDFEQAVRQEAIDYFETFAQRSDWDKSCSYYREDLHFKDITLQLELDSLWNMTRLPWKTQLRGAKKTV